MFLGNNYNQEFMSYDITEKKWQQIGTDSLSVDFNYYPGILVTSDERYFVIFCTYEEFTEETASTIEIFDLEDHTVRTSKIKLPSDDRMREMHVFLTKDDDRSYMIIIGYLKQIWKDKKFRDMQQVPSELIAMIVKFYDTDIVHLIERWTGCYWKISIDDILEFE